MAGDALASWRENVRLMADGYADDVLERVDTLRGEGTVYPPRGMELRALELVPFDAVRVVLLGQDPYHGPGQAHGLAFSVPDGMKTPPSLRNVFKELEAEGYGTAAERGTDLTPWAEQGVLLLNTVLTVGAGRPASHASLGWQAFTDACVAALSQRRERLVFLLWGAHARAKAELVDPARHLVLETAHPSPFSAHRGFFGCGHFRLANDFLSASGGMAVSW